MRCCRGFAGLAVDCHSKLRFDRLAADNPGSQPARQLTLGSERECPYRSQPGWVQRTLPPTRKTAKLASGDFSVSRYPPSSTANASPSNGISISAFSDADPGIEIERTDEADVSSMTKALVCRWARPWSRKPSHEFELAHETAIARRHGVPHSAFASRRYISWLQPRGCQVRTTQL